jgi:LysR family tcuABC transcriptional regulator
MELRQLRLDLAVLFDTPLKTGHNAETARRWSVLNLLEEDLFLIASRQHAP